MRAPLLVAFALAACGDTASSTGLSSGPGMSSAPSMSTSSTSGDTSSTGGDSAGSSTSASTGTLRDVGSDDDFGTDQPLGCKGKVDLLFLISRAGLMDRVQEQFVASFPGFVQTIEERLGDFDLHIMAANPDGSWPGKECESAWWGCPMNWPTCGPQAEDWICAESIYEWQPCDEKLGAGLTFNAGAGATNKRCELYGGNRYIIDGEPNMDEVLECIAKVGWSGSAAIGDALVAAMSLNLNGASGCNAGFLRADALLVVVIIANTQDQKSLSSVITQHKAVLAVKKDPNAVVMLAITGPPEKEGEPPIPGCIYDNLGVVDFQALLEKFPYNLRGDACAPTYAPFFDDAVGMIDEACGKFIPQ